MGGMAIEIRSPSEDELRDAHGLLLALSLDRRCDPRLVAAVDRRDFLDAKPRPHARADRHRRGKPHAVDAVVHREPIPAVARELEPELRQ